ncbi:hypothetical protein ACFQU2_27145 [Siccirubricoccus deserti]
MPIARRTALALHALLLASGARAQAFPNRPVRLIVPYTPGASPTSPPG